MEPGRFQHAYGGTSGGKMEAGVSLASDEKNELHLSRELRLSGVFILSEDNKASF